MSVKRLLSAGFFLVPCALAAAPPADEGFRKLSGRQIRQTFAGRTFSDDVHFSFRYAADGSIQGGAMGRKIDRRWRIERDLLCVTESVGENCYVVWKKGNAVKLLFDGNDAGTEGFVR